MHHTRALKNGTIHKHIYSISAKEKQNPWNSIRPAYTLILLFPFKSHARIIHDTGRMDRILEDLYNNYPHNLRKKLQNGR